MIINRPVVIICVESPEVLCLGTVSIVPSIFAPGWGGDYWVLADEVERVGQSSMPLSVVETRRVPTCLRLSRSSMVS